MAPPNELFNLITRTDVARTAIVSDSDGDAFRDPAELAAMAENPYFGIPGAMGQLFKCMISFSTKVGCLTPTEFLYGRPQNMVGALNIRFPYPEPMSEMTNALIGPEQGRSSIVFLVSQTRTDLDGEKALNLYMMAGDFIPMLVRENVALDSRPVRIQLDEVIRAVLVENEKVRGYLSGHGIEDYDADDFTLETYYSTYEEPIVQSGFTYTKRLSSPTINIYVGGDGKTAPEWLFVKNGSIIASGTSLPASEGRFLAADTFGSDLIFMAHQNWTTKEILLSAVAMNGTVVLTKYPLNLGDVKAFSGSMSLSMASHTPGKVFAIVVLSSTTSTEGKQEYHRCLQYDINLDAITNLYLQAKSPTTTTETGSISGIPVGAVSSIEKRMVALPGWRYMIGLRGIDLYNRTFAETSSLMTKTLRTKEPITKISLETVETIPNEFLAYGLAERNNWIQYQISVNGADWYPISPLHHSPLGQGTIPPKIYEVGRALAREQDIQILRGLIPSSEPVYEVRLRILYKRPKELPDMTPVLEEYCLHCIHEGGLL